MKNWIIGNLIIYYMLFGIYGLNFMGDMGYIDCIKKDMVFGDCILQNNDGKILY